MTQIGKRYSCGHCGQQVLVVKQSATGELTCCEHPMQMQQPKQTPSAD